MAKEFKRCFYCKKTKKYLECTNVNVSKKYRELALCPFQIEKQYLCEYYC